MCAIEMMHPSQVKETSNSLGKEALGNWNGPSEGETDF